MNPLKCFVLNYRASEIQKTAIREKKRKFKFRASYPNMEVLEDTGIEFGLKPLFIESEHTIESFFIWC